MFRGFPENDWFLKLFFFSFISKSLDVHLNHSLNVSSIFLLNGFLMDANIRADSLQLTQIRQRSHRMWPHICSNLVLIAQILNVPDAVCQKKNHWNSTKIQIQFWSPVYRNVIKKYLKTYNFLKKRLQYTCFSVNFSNFLKLVSAIF